MERILWLFNNYDDNRGLWGSFLASLLLHVLMFAVMATTSIFYPVTGDSSKLDVVWLYPSFLLGGDVEPVAAPQEPAHVENALSPPRKNVPAPVAVKPPPEPEKIASKPQDTEPVQQPSPLRDDQEATADAAAPAPEPEESESEPEMTLPAAASPQVAKAETKPSEAESKPPKTEPKPPKTEPKPPKTEPKPPKTEPLAEKPAPRENPVVVKQEKQTPKTIPLPEKSEIKTAAIDKPVPPPVISPPPVKKDVQAVVAPIKEEPHRAVVPSATAQKPAPSSPPPATLPAVKAAGPGPAMARKKSESLPVTGAAKEEKPPEKTSAKTSSTKGIFAPPLIGDLKLEISASPEALNEVKIAVRFCEYPKTRHNRPMPKGDARRVQTLTPKIAKQSEKSIVVVIESTGEGIYEFRNISDSSNAAKADFKIKVYENSSRAKTKQVGNRKISDKGTIVKIMMPEGILWDDEAAFSGSMEDADSITKFNTDTGLVWKEYRD